MRVYLDDVREAPAGWVRARVPEEVICFLRDRCVEEISLDHDLGENCGTGYDVLLWIEEQVFLGFLKEVPIIYIHTSNPPARMKMQAAKDRIERMKGELYGVE